MKVIHNPLKSIAALGTSIAAAVMFTATPSMADQNAVPLNHPTEVVYPSELAEQGIESECQAVFTVTVDGKPEEIQVTCDHPGFESSTRNAAAQLIFQPKTIDGEPVAQKGVTYPLIFRLSE